ncbi:MAG TPA: pyridoxal phosphate-dependent aminotransferase [Vicinamibacterales bacterium]|nr:pyridoxal phosphate-dependent aminotransferase [Vicinamibacterales bacterium]
MARYLDSVPLSGITLIRDLMYSVKDPFRLDQGDLSFDAPDSVKAAMTKAIADNRSHYLQTNGLPQLRELIAAKLRERNGTPVESAEEILVTNGGMHGIYAVMQALLEPGDEVVVPDPEWPPTVGHVLAAHGVPVACPLHESLDWRYDLDEFERLITPRTKALYINTPNNPTGGLLTRPDLERIAAIARERDLWIFSDEAYEDMVYDGAAHISMASLPGMYERTIPIYTYSKSYAMTGLRLGYVAVKDATIRERAKKVIAYTTANVASVVQYGGIGALQGSRDCIDGFVKELDARRSLFYQGLAELGGIFTGQPPKAAFYAFVKIDPAWKSSPEYRQAGKALPGHGDSISWRMAEHLITHGRIGNVPGADFGEHGEGHIRFCFARDRKELAGALDSMKALFGVRV